MTVAAVILVASPASALADADGTPAVRRMADVAWAGGATPVVVDGPDPDGALGAVLATAEATITAAAAGLGPAGRVASAIDAAVGLVGATGAVIVWPARYAWVDAETVTTLIATHGEDSHSVLRPSFRGRPGWPALLPVALRDQVRALLPDRPQPDGAAADLPDDVLDHLAAAGIRLRIVETGDPGVTHDVSVPRSALPAYDGPPEPEDGVAREWGAAAADEPDDAPVPGRGRPDPVDPDR